MAEEAILNIIFLKVEGGEVGVKVKAGGSWKLEDCSITDSKVCFKGGKVTIPVLRK